MRKTKTNQNFLARSNLKWGLSTKLSHKINEQDSVENYELSSFPNEYLRGFREMDKRQKVRKLLFKESEYKLS
jgi:hypothetical protein